METEIILDSFNKLYNAGEYVTGSLLIKCYDRLFEFTKMFMNITGNFTIKNNKVNPAHINTVKFYSKKILISENGKIISGSNNNFPFKFLLEDEKVKDQSLIETYQGVLISIAYELQVEILGTKNTYTSDPKKINIFVPKQGVNDEIKTKVVPYEFDIKPDNLERVKIVQSKVPNFFFSCKIDNTNCDLNKPFVGSVTIKESEIPIKSIELQFIRNETINLPNDILTEVSEIQNLQVGDGDVNKDVEIPLFMIFPRYFTCASLNYKMVKLSFELNIIIVLINGFVITENFPINTWRS